MKGRKPTPTSLKLLKGNPGKRAINKREPMPTAGGVGCPTWLSKEAKAEWRRVSAELDKLGLLTKVDRAALATYCESWSTFVKAQALIERYGLVYMREEERFTNDDGDTVIVVRPAKIPAVAIAKDAAATIRAFCTEFGLTPSSRSRMTVPDVDDDDLDAMKQRRRAEREAKR